MAKVNSWQTKAENALKSGNVAEMRKAYADIRHASQKRIARMEKVGYRSDEIVKMKDMKKASEYSDNAIKYQLKYMMKLMNSKGASLKEVKTSVAKGGELGWKIKNSNHQLSGDKEHQLRVYVGAILHDEALYVYIPDFLDSLDNGEIMTNSVRQLYEKLVKYAEQIQKWGD